MFDYLNDLIVAKPDRQALHWVLFANGDPEAQNNILLFGFPPGQDEPTHVAKICRNPQFNHTIRAEYEQMQELWQILGSQAEGFAPFPWALGEHGDDLVLLMSYCPGALLSAKPATYWVDVAQMKLLWQQAALCLGKLHGQTAVTKPSTSRPDPDFKTKVAVFQSLFTITVEETQELEDLLELVLQTDKQAETNVLLQGDFWPGNVILHPQHGQFTLIDWQFSRWSSDASLDVYLFILACSQRAVPYAPPNEQATAVAGIIVEWEKSILPAYLDTYNDLVTCAILPPRAGMLACCVEMAARPMLTFGIQHEDSLFWKALFTELRKHL